MKMTMMISLVFCSFMFSNGTFAQSELNKILENNETTQSNKVKKRRKKVHMCHECGKPETECDCEGEEHGIKDGHEKKDK